MCSNETIGQHFNAIDDYKFIQTANLIIENHGCRAIMIDIKTRTINIECPPGVETACAQALEDQLGGCTEDCEEIGYTTLEGWPV